MLIDLSGASPIAAGGKRDIYLHPHDETQIIKVISDRRQKKQNARGTFERLYKPRYEWEFIREISTVYRAGLIMNGAPDNPSPIIAGAGLVQTTKGLGLSAEKITAPDGTLAPQLSKLLPDPSFADRYLPQFNRFVKAVFDFQIVASDLNANNIVYSQSEDRFIAIDGFGSRTLIPIFVWSKRANDRNLRKTFQKKIAERCALHWDDGACQFYL